MQYKYYTIYKTTNILNGKYYIGMHRTNELEDGYIGSGKTLKKAIEKYGIENFTKEILHVFDNEQDMKDKEKELVIISEETYNLCEGGHGGFGYINRNNINNKNHEHIRVLVAHKLRGRKNIKISNSLRKQYEDGTRIKKIDPLSFLGKKHKEESKKRIGEKNSRHQQGMNNSQYGTIWITNGKENKKISSLDSVPEGWYKGRTVNKGR